MGGVEPAPAGPRGPLVDDHQDPRSSERSDASRWLARLVAVHALDLFDVLVDGVALGRLVLDRARCWRSRRS
jgi:hypothetical protein